MIYKSGWNLLTSDPSGPLLRMVEEAIEENGKRPSELMRLANGKYDWRKVSALRTPRKNLNNLLQFWLHDSMGYRRVRFTIELE